MAKSYSQVSSLCLFRVLAENCPSPKFSWQTWVPSLGTANGACVSCWFPGQVAKDFRALPHLETSRMEAIRGKQVKLHEYTRPPVTWCRISSSMEPQSNLLLHPVHPPEKWTNRYVSTCGYAMVFPFGFPFNQPEKGTEPQETHKHGRMDPIFVSFFAREAISLDLRE